LECSDELWNHNLGRKRTNGILDELIYAVAAAVSESVE
jgi:hypothetical protein